MPSNSPLSTTFEECKQEALKNFYDLLKELADRNQATPPLPPGNFSPPPIVHETLNQLNNMMKTFESSSLMDPSRREEQFVGVLTAVIDPLLHVCTLSSTHIKHPAHVAVYLINCLSLIQSSLSKYDFTASRVEMLAANIEAHMDTLIQEEMSTLLIRCKLAGKIQILQNTKPGEVLSKVSGMDVASLTEAMRSFEKEFLLIGGFSECDKLINPQLKATARIGVSRLVCIAYTNLYDAIVDSKNNYPQPHSIVHYKPDQIKTILDAL